MTVAPIITNSRTLLLVGTSPLVDSVNKGVEDLYEQFLEGDFFDHVVVYVPFAKERLETQLSPRIRFVQPGLISRRYRGLKFIGLPFEVARMVLLGRRLIHQVNPSVVRATDALLSGSLACLVSGRRIPFVVSVHSDWELMRQVDPESYIPTLLGSRKLAVRLENFVMNRARRVMAISEHVKRSLVAQGVNEEAIDVLYHGVPDPSGTAGSQNPPLLPGPSASQKVVVVGRLSRQKRLDEVLAAARLFLVSGRTELVFIGDGPERSRIETLVCLDPVLAEYVHFLGFVTRTEAIELIKQAHVSLVPLGGYSLIEAALCAQAVVAFDNEWHSEIIVDGETGLLVNPHDTQGIADAVTRLLDDSALRSKLGWNLRKVASARHDQHVAQENRRLWYQVKVLNLDDLSDSHSDDRNG